MREHIAERKSAPFDDIWGKILDFRLHKFQVMSILKECALLQKSPTSEKAWNQFLYKPECVGNCRFENAYEVM